MPKPSFSPHLALALALAASATAATPAGAQTVGSRADAAHACLTDAVAGWELRAQLARAETCWYPAALVPVTPGSGLTYSAGALRYASPETRTALYAARRRHAVNVTSGFRTMLEQYWLYTSGSCGSVLPPGSSNHESGTAVDVANSSAVRAALTASGCRWPNIARDPWHLDCLPRSATRRTVITFQRLWNLNHPSDRITADNVYGPQTRARLRASPIHGFARMPCTTPPTPPPPPPSCDHTAAGLTFSCDGVEAGQVCVSLNEPEDPDGWSDNHLCSATDIGFVFSTDGPREGMRCTNVTEPDDVHAEAWSNDYACVPESSTLDVTWSSSGVVAGWDCVRWGETSDPMWSDDYLCVRPLRCSSAGDLTFCSDGPVAGATCELVNEPEDPDGWDDNHFCSASPVGMVWSHDGLIDGMTCTQIDAPDDDHAAAWSDDYLCLPDDSDLAFTWSHEGPIEGEDCVRWYESAEDATRGWGDSYLCVGAVVRLDAGVASSDAGVRTDARVPERDGGRDRPPVDGSCACRVSSPAGTPNLWMPIASCVLLAGLGWRRSRRSSRLG